MIGDTAWGGNARTSRGGPVPGTEAASKACSAENWRGQRSLVQGFDIIGNVGSLESIWAFG